LLGIIASLLPPSHFASPHLTKVAVIFNYFGDSKKCDSSGKVKIIPAATFLSKVRHGAGDYTGNLPPPT
jgi:hypothetical protein